MEELASKPIGTLDCLLCGGAQIYPGPRYQNHLIHEHGVVFNVEYLIKSSIHKRYHKGQLPNFMINSGSEEAKKENKKKKKKKKKDKDKDRSDKKRKHRSPERKARPLSPPAKPGGLQSSLDEWDISGKPPSRDHHR